jgi:hypothetical protein
MPSTKLNPVCLRLAGPILIGLLAIFVESPVVIKAQAIPAASLTPPWSRFETYGGYSYLNPPNSSAPSYKNQPQGAGAALSMTVYIDHVLGLEGQFDLFPHQSTDPILRAEAGPALRFPLGHLIPLLHVLAGGVRASGPQAQSPTWGFGFTAGASFDYVLPKFGAHLSFRPVQVDFAYTRITYEGPEAARITGFQSQISSGLLYRYGEIVPRQPLTMGCTADAVEVFPGEPITITAHLLDGDSRHAPKFKWIGTGGSLEGNGDVVRVDTRRLAPGDYVATGTAQEGSKSTSTARCTVEFRVRQLQPPISSSFGNTTVDPQNGAVTIDSVAHALENGLLIHIHSASSGIIVGSRANANSEITVLPVGEVQVLSQATRDSSQAVTARAVIRITPPEEGKSVRAPDSCTGVSDEEERSATLLNHMARVFLDQIAADRANQPKSTSILVAKHSTDHSPSVAALLALCRKPSRALESNVL